MFIQSHVRQVNELNTILSMVSPLGKLTDLPTFKEKAREQPHNINYGLVGYPVLMTADIALYKADTVPVGVDQAPHIEFARETVRSFNYRFKTQVLIEPKMKATEFPKVLGTDGVQKMSKSLNNHIELAATPEETEKRVLTMVTDPARIRLTDPGNPDVCNVFSFHKMFSGAEEIAMVNTECRRAGIGCVDCKKLMAKNLNESLVPFRTRREEFTLKPDEVWNILKDGAARASIIAEKTMEEVRTAVGLP
jgi:tryptophanyl-tRNA synthetase